MADYIDREALQVALQRKKAHATNGRYTEGWNDCLMRFKSMVSCFPAADVAPVVHGRWAPLGNRATIFKCSACNKCEPHVSDYCPNCGAKMEGSADDAVG